MANHTNHHTDATDTDVIDGDYTITETSLATVKPGGLVTGAQDFADAPTYEQLCNAATSGLQSENSARVYGVTYGKWQAWADEHGHDARAINAPNVRAFLDGQRTAKGYELSKATKSRQLTALRKLARALVLGSAMLTGYENVAYKAALGTLSGDFFKVRQSANGRPSGKSGRALSRTEAQDMINYWRGKGDTPQAVRTRNTALIAVLLCVGLRRDELVNLTWQDVNFTDATLNIRHGKGDKARYATVFASGTLDALRASGTLDALRAWQEAQPDGYAFVFTAFASKGGKHGPDKPMTAQAVYKLFKQTGVAVGLPGLSPHDARRTLITELHREGVPLAEISAQAGHANAATTLVYTKPIDASARGNKYSIGYGR